MAGNIRKRGEKWYYSFEASTVGGKRKRIERVGGRTKKEAEAALRKALQEYENAGLHFEPSEMSVADYIDYWMKNYVELNCKYSSKNSYLTVIKNHIKPNLGKYRLKALTPTVLQDLINLKYKEGYSKKHLENIRIILNSSLKYAVYPCNFIKGNPMQYIKTPKYARQIESCERVITQEDFQKIIDRFPPSSNYYIALMIAYHTGCRIGETVSLTWSDVDLVNKLININKGMYTRNGKWCLSTPKTKSSVRKIAIGSMLVDILKAHKKWQIKNQLKYGEYYTYYNEVHKTIGPEIIRFITPCTLEDIYKQIELKFISTRENGTLVNPDNFKWAFKVIHHELGLDYTFHSLRHTHATKLIENGVNVKEVQCRLGHKDVQTTLAIYTHATEKMDRDSVAIFEQAIKNDLPTVAK